MKETEQSSRSEEVAVVAKREWHAPVVEEVDYTRTEAAVSGTFDVLDGTLYTA